MTKMYTGDMSKKRGKKGKKIIVPIQYWSYSSLMAFLRNPLAWYKRYVQHVYDVPRTPAAVIGSAAHLALQHFYSGIDKSGSIDLGLEYLRNIPDFEINFGKAKTRLAQKRRLTLIRKMSSNLN